MPWATWSRHSSARRRSTICRSRIHNWALATASSTRATYKAGTDNKSYANEHRIHQQFLTRQRFGGLISRTATGWRSGSCLLAADRGSATRWPSISAAEQARNDEGHGLFFAYNELFVNAKTPIFDRDRLYGGIGYAVTPTLRFETGLMYQLFETRKRPQWQVVCFHNVDLRGNDND